MTHEGDDSTGLMYGAVVPLIVSGNLFPLGTVTDPRGWVYLMPT